MADDDVIDQRDGLVATQVGEWVNDKHDLLKNYIKLTAGARRKFLGYKDAGATFVDLFCGPGRSKIRDTEIWVDGSSQVAWNESQKRESSFSQIMIADLHDEYRDACELRLIGLKAPVRTLAGSAVKVAKDLSISLNQNGLHLVFIDPFSLGSLDFRIFEYLSKLRHVDLIVHVSAMDLQRNLKINQRESDDFNTFCPGWKTEVEPGGKFGVRSKIIELWKSRIAALGFDGSVDMRLITGNQGQRLYWLLVVTKHELAKKLWKVVSNVDGQREFPF